MSSGGLKWLVGLGGFVIVLLTGFNGLFALIWLVAFLYVLVKPAKKIEQRDTPVVQSDDSLRYLEERLRAELNAEQNADIKKGIERSLHLVRELNTPSVTPAVAAQVPSGEEAKIELSNTISKPVDQTVALLYVGAFLFLGGMGLFIVYGGLPNEVRLTLICLLAAVMYIVGLALYKAKENLRPAGATFLAIGLMLIPLAGYAAVYLVDVSSETSWLVTSVIGLAAYFYAFVRTQAEVMAYLVFLMWLSLAESAVHTFGAPMQWFIWSALVLAILTQLLVPRIVRSGAKLGQPFWWSNMALVPAALVVAYFCVTSNTIELWHLGVSLLLAGLYSLASLYASRFVSDDTLTRSDHLIGAHTLTITGVLVLLHESFNGGIDFGVLLLVTGVFHALGWLLAYEKLRDLLRYEAFLYVSGPLLAVASWVWVKDDAGWKAIVVGVVLGLSLMLCIMSRRLFSMITALLASMLFPVVFINALPQVAPIDQLQWIAVGYAVIFTAYALLRYHFRFGDVATTVIRAGYIWALAMAWLVALVSGEYALQVLVTLLVLCTVVIASFAEKAPRAFGLFGLVLTTLVVLIFHHQLVGVDLEKVAVYGIGIAALVTYIFSFVFDDTRGRLLAISAIIGGFLAWFISLSLTSFEPWIYISPLIPLATAAVVWSEKRRLGGGKYFTLAPLAIALFALCQYLAQNHPSTDWLVYTHVWTAYLVYSAYLLKKNGAPHDTFDTIKYGALLMFTVPVAFQALIQGDEYSLLLLCEQVALLVFGVLTARRYLVWWATIVSILVIVYSLREFGYLQLVVIAVALIGYALYRLAHKTEQ